MAEPTNYYHEYPQVAIREEELIERHQPVQQIEIEFEQVPLNEHRSQEETEMITRSIHDELEKRGLNHRSPLSRLAKLGGITDT